MEFPDFFSFCFIMSLVHFENWFSDFSQISHFAVLKEHSRESWIRCFWVSFFYNFHHCLALTRHYHASDPTLVYWLHQLFSFDVNSCNTWHFHLVCERKVDFWKFLNTLTDCRCRKADTSFWSRCDLSNHHPGNSPHSQLPTVGFVSSSVEN